MSLRRFLTRLIALCVLPLLALAAYLAVESVLNTIERRDVAARSIAKNFAVSIDQNLNSRIRALRIIADSPLTDDPSRHAGLYHEAHAFHGSFGSHVILADTEGRMLFNTRVPYGTPLPPVPRPKGRSAMAETLATRMPAVGDLFIGPIAAEPLVAIAVPDVHFGRVRHVVIANVEARQYQARLEQEFVPGSWSLSLLDSTGGVIARRAPPGFDSAKDVDPEGRFEVPLEFSPWSVVLEIPREVYREPIIHAATLLLFVLLAATMASVVGGSLSARSLSRMVSSLAQPPRAGGPAPAIREIAEARRVLDDTARQRNAAEAALSESEQRFRAIFEQAAIGIAVLSPDGRILHANRAACEYFGYQEDEFITHTFQQLTHPADLAGNLEMRERFIRREISSFRAEKRYIRKDGQVVWGHVSLALVRDTNGNPEYFIAVIENIQKRKEAETALRDLNATLEERVAARTAELTAINYELDSFAYAVSHDLRAPLRSVDGFAKILEEDYADRLDDDGRDALRRVRAAATRMGELITDLLELSRLGNSSMSIEPLDLCPLARRVIDELRSREPGREVTLTLPETLPVHGDRRLLAVLLENLLANAWKFTGKHAQAHIEIGTLDLPGEQAFYVRDDGAGFEMSRAGTLFTPFQRLHSASDFPDTGIGFATVRRVVQRHGGRIWVDAAPERGATFYFTLAARRSGKE